MREPIFAVCEGAMAMWSIGRSKWLIVQWHVWITSTSVDLIYKYPG